MKLLVVGAILLAAVVFFAIREIWLLTKGKDLDIDFSDMKFTGDPEQISTECSI